MAVSSQERGQGLAASFADPTTPLTVPRMTSQYSPFAPWRATMDRDERRQNTRRSLHCKLQLIDDALEEVDSPLVIPGECLNVCDGGLYGVVPIGYGVAMGQRYTFRLIIEERGPELSNVQIVSQQGQVVRTELLIGEDGNGDRVGIAVRLCGHRTGVVPMPV